MAVVRFSDELKESILSNARSVFQKRIEAQSAAVPQLGDVIADMVYAPIQPAIDAAPKNMFSWRSDMELHSIGNKRYGIGYKLNTPRAVPNHPIDTGTGKITGGYRIEFSIPDTPEYADIKAQIDQWQNNLNALGEQRNEFVAGVKKIIEAHSTLAPALKAWPPLWDLVSEPYRERHRKVVERVKPDTPEIDVDLTKLTSTVAASKILK